MEKYIVFGPIVLFFGLFVLLTLGFLLLVIKLVLKAKKDEWVGTVIDKNHIVKQKDDSKQKEHLYSYKVQLENGEIHGIAASQTFFNEISVGDKLRKERGSLWPKKI